MRYYSDSSTLFIRGSFRAASTGLSGGIHPVSTIISHTVHKDGGSGNPKKDLELVAASSGIGYDFFGLLTQVPIRQLVVLQIDFITVFISATTSCIGNNREAATSASIIVYSGEGMEDAALLEAIMVSTEAKTEALLALDPNLTGTSSDAVIIACEGVVTHAGSGRNTEAGRRIREAVLHGIPELFRRSETKKDNDRPSFFIYSRIKGEHWVEWTPDNCPYVPCHFQGQRCDFCYCPFYPCKNESLGQWAESSNGRKVWNCARCTLLHEPRVADYLKKFPGASLKELVRRRENDKGE